MKRTGLLTVMAGLSVKKGKLIIHPNDGYELGLMNKEYQVGMYMNEKIDVFKKGSLPSLDGSICLENDCKHGVVEMSTKQWSELGQPDKVMLVYEKGRLLILGKDL